MSAICTALRAQVAAYADDELGADAAILIGRHLAACAACRRTVARQRHLARALRELHPQDEPPPGLEARVRHAVLGPTPAPRRALAVGVALVAVAGVLGAYGATALRGSAASDGSAFVDERVPGGTLERPYETALATAVAIHRRSDDHALPLTDVVDVNAWLRARLPFAADVRTPGSAGIALEGVTVVTLDDHPAGLVRYRMDGRAVSLFLLAAPAWDADGRAVRVGTVEFRVFHRPGVDLVGWSHAALSYLLVSDDGLAAGAACAACHGDDGRRSIAEFVRALRGDAADARAAQTRKERT